MKGHLKLEEQPFQWINRDDLPTREDVLRFTRLQFLTYVLSYAHNPELAEDIAGAYRASTIRQHEIAWRSLQTWLQTNDTPINKTTIFLKLLIQG